MNMLGKQLKSIDELEKYGLVLVEGRGMGNSVIENMKKKDMTLTDLSVLTGISKQLVHNIVNDKNVPGVDIAIKISKVLDVPVDKLFYFRDNYWALPYKEQGKRVYLDKEKLEIVSEDEIDKYNNKDRFIKLGRKILIK